MQYQDDIEANIRNQFVTSLMEYFKIEEDINLRSHISDLIRNVDRTQFREFLRRLSAGDMPYKSAFEKIALVAQSLENEMLDSLFGDVKRQSKYLYDLMYDLHRKVLFESDNDEDAKGKFENIYFAKIKDKNSNKLLLSSRDLKVVKAVGKVWIFDHVAFDKSLFLQRIEQEYKNQIMQEERSNAAPQLHNIIQEKLLSASSESGS